MHDLQGPANPLDPLSLLRMAMKVAPVTRWVMAAVGLVAGGSIVTALVTSPVYGITAVAGILVCMVAIFIFSRATAMAARSTKLLTLVFLWFCGIIVMAAVACVFASAFFGVPWPIRQKLFATTVAIRAKEAGSPELARAASGLSSDAVTKLIEISNARHDLGYFDPHTGDYLLSPVPKEVWELERHGLIAWSGPKENFASLLRRLDLIPWAPGPAPQVIPHTRELTSDDREALRTFSYELNDQGTALYRLILDTVLRQAREV